MSTGRTRPEPMKRYLEMLKNIRNRTGLATLNDLERAGIGSRSTLSRIFRGEKRVPDDVLKALCGSAGVKTSELDLLRNLRDEAFDSGGRAGEDANQGGDAAAGEGAGPRGEYHDHEFSVSGTRSASGRLFHRGGGRLAFVAGAAVLAVAVSAVVFVIQPWSSSSPSPDCAKYEVTIQGNVVDDAGKSIGNVFPKDVFVVDRSPGHSQFRYRYYGTVENQGISGYVLQNKLNLLGSCT